MPNEDIHFDSLEMLFKTPEGREVLDIFFYTWGSTGDIIKATDYAKKTAEKAFASSIPLQIAGVLDLFKIIALVNRDLLIEIEKLVLDLIGRKKEKA